MEKIENRYNLIDEKWILSNVGRVSLMDCFTNDEIREIGGAATQKLCLLKLLFAIGQASNSFDSVDEIASAGIEAVRENIVSYLNDHYDQFWMYGERPFLQFAKLADFDPNQYFVKYNMNLFDENAASGNNGVYVDSQVKNTYDDADKANLLIVNLGSPVKAKPKSLDGEKKSAGKVEKQNVQFTTNKKYVKKATIKSEKVVTGDNLCCGFFNGGGSGILHGFVTGKSIMQTVYVNILSDDEISSLTKATEKGVAPWEIDDLDEEHDYKETYYAYLVPMNRFMLFNESNTDFRCTEGIQYYNIEGTGKDMTMKNDFIASQPDIFVYNYKKLVKKSKKGNDEYEFVRTLVAPNQRESVIYSLRPFIESHKGNKEDVYNGMINHSSALLSILEKNGGCVRKEYGIEYVGTEYKNQSGSTSRIGYADKRFGYGTKIGSDEKRLVEIANFIGDTTIDFGNPKADPKCACAIIERTVNNLKRFYLDYVYKSGDSKMSIKDVKFSENEFRQKCRCLLRGAEMRSVNGNFDINEELENFKKSVDELAREEIGISNCHDRGRKIEIAYNVGLSII